MPRSARIIFPGYPHHIIQRGNRLQKVFFSEKDKAIYKVFLGKFARQYGLKIWAYCFMDNHVHIIGVPDRKDSIALAIGETHKKYSKMINKREGWTGHLWQDRFKSFTMDERYLYAAVRYVERNPVRAGLVSAAEDYSNSSARVHVNNSFDNLLSDFYLLEDIVEWSEYLKGENPKELTKMRGHLNTGKPLF